MTTSKPIDLTAAPSQQLPPEMVVQSSWFRRARNFPIFSAAWCRYRSATFLIGLPATVLLLASMAAVRVQPREVDWPDLLQVAGVYCLPFVVLVLLGPWLAVAVRRRAWPARIELAAMLFVLLLGMAVSLATFFHLKGLYQTVRIAPVTGERVAHSLPSFQMVLSWSRVPTFTTVDPKAHWMLMNPEVRKAYDAMQVARAEYLRTISRRKKATQDSAGPLTAAEQTAMTTYLQLVASNVPLTPAQQAATESGLAAYEKFLRFAVETNYSATHKPVRTEPVPAEQKAAHDIFNRAVNEFIRLNAIERARVHKPIMVPGLQYGLKSATGAASAILLLAVLVLLMAWLGGITDLVGFIRQRGKLDDVLQAQRMQRASAARAHAELRLSVLAAQIEPHFLFNTLASMRSAIVSDQARAAAIVDHLVDYLRATIPQMRHDAISPSVPLVTQLNAARAYLALMRERMPRLSFAIDAGPGLDAAQIPPLMLISLVENAVKHGIEPKPGPARITVSARRVSIGDTTLLELQVSDDGVGFGSATSGGGIGLANIQERLTSLYGSEAGLALRALPDGGVAAILHLPLTFTSGPTT